MDTSPAESEAIQIQIEQLRARLAAIAQAIVTVDLQIRAIPEGFSGSPFETIREQYESYRTAALSFSNHFIELAQSIDQTYTHAIEEDS
jgi:uncharacterized protein YukE